MLIYFLIPATPSTLFSPGHFQIWQKYVPPLSQCLKKRLNLQAVLRFGTQPCQHFKCSFWISVFRTWPVKQKFCLFSLYLSSFPLFPAEKDFFHSHHHTTTSLPKKADFFSPFEGIYCCWISLCCFFSLLSPLPYPPLLLLFSSFSCIFSFTFSICILGLSCSNISQSWYSILLPQTCRHHSSLFPCEDSEINVEEKISR